MKKFNPRIQEIKSGRFDNLQISLDFDSRPSRTFPVLLFTPDMQNPENHFHIKLNKREVSKLSIWLKTL